jgi:hypothetical protein
LDSDNDPFDGQISEKCSTPLPRPKAQKRRLSSGSSVTSANSNKRKAKPESMSHALIYLGDRIASTKPPDAEDYETKAVAILEEMIKDGDISKMDMATAMHIFSDNWRKAKMICITKDVDVRKKYVVSTPFIIRKILMRNLPIIGNIISHNRQ